MERSLRHVGLRLLGRAHVGLGHDLHQRHAGAVEIDVGVFGMLVVDRLAGVLLQVQALDADLERLAVGAHLDLALADDRALVLRDLVALRQVRIEVVLAVEHRGQVDARLEAEAGAHRLIDAGLVDHRQHAGHGRIHQRHVAVGSAAEGRRRAREQLGVGGDLGMHLQADHDLPVAGGALDQVAVALASRVLHHHPHAGRPWRLARAGCLEPHPAFLAKSGRRRMTASR